MKTPEQQEDITREIENLMPWEPIIRACRNVFTWEWQPDPEDTCQECGEPLHGHAEIMVANNAGDNFCSWDCLVKQAKECPEYYKIESLGAYYV